VQEDLRYPAERFNEKGCFLQVWVGDALRASSPPKTVNNSFMLKYNNDRTDGQMNDRIQGKLHFIRRPLIYVIVSNIFETVNAGIKIS